MARFETLEVTAPACWASYLFNGDASGIDRDDEQACDDMVERIGWGAPTDCSDEPEFADSPDYSTHNERGGKYAADCLTYTFLRRIEE